MENGPDFPGIIVHPGSGSPQKNWPAKNFAEAARLALESDAIDFEILHIVGTPEAEKSCNVARSRDVLGLTYKGDLEQYR